MKFSISQFTNLYKEQIQLINDLSNELELFFKPRTYGSGLCELYIGLITVKPEFDKFSKKRRPAYKPGKRNWTVDGATFETNNYAEIEAKLDYLKVYKLEPSELIEVVCKEILIECESLTRLSKLKDFDYKMFRSDLEAFLIEKSVVKK